MRILLDNIEGMILIMKFKFEQYKNFVFLGLIAIAICAVFLGDAQYTVIYGSNYKDVSLNDCLSYVKGYETDDYKNFRVTETDPQILFDFSKLQNNGEKVKCVTFELGHEIQMPYVHVYYGRDTAEMSAQDSESVSGGYSKQIKVCSQKSVEGFMYLRLDVDKDFTIENIKIAYDYQTTCNFYIIGFILLIILGTEFLGFCFIKNTKINKDILYSVFLIALTIISIIPLLKLCKYIHPCADDFGYSYRTFHEWNKSHSLWNLLKEAIATSKYFYNNWQGLYSSAFFLALQPSIFGEKYYALTGILLLIIIGETVRKLG